ncbi:RHS repeat domain-containing protein [Bacteroides nordii]|uniref:RHS repeat domain-containing protein n=1 Tax=Bacteroides nordii TaxID=291645 RepID=UPI00189A9F9D|nr:RHS repeat-associated core domain-containing protein [Bacteroides nordii]
MNQENGVLSCKYYKVNSSGNLEIEGNYRPASLYVTMQTDEDGNVSYVFTDMRGKQILTRQLSDNISHDTYYIYDDLDNLRFVLSPMYQQKADIDLYAYQYRYDDRGRCIWKKIPGCGPVIYVYDKADRLVFSQDSLQRAQDTPKWDFYVYDKLGRTLLYGICSNNNIDEARDDIITGVFSNTTNTIGNSGYNSNFSLISPSVRKVYYYDNYDFLELPSFTDRSRFPLPTVKATGLLTGENVWQAMAYYYDSKGQLIQSSGSEISETTDYSFTGQPLKVERVYHIRLPMRILNPHEIYMYHYDGQDRVHKIEHQIIAENQTSDSPVITLAENLYDDIGRLQMKKLHNGAISINYSYNIRNWISDITNKHFKEHLYYNTGPSKACYNGNISAFDWEVSNSSTLRNYKLSYDGLNRMTSAIYSEGVAYNINENHFSELIDEYDLNGNIKRLRRYGKSNATSYGLIDNLTLEYNGNQLKYVDDAATDPLRYGVSNFVNDSDREIEYVYDGNGNLIQDYNKGIALIQYNYLNQPTFIHFKNGHSIDYSYGNDGSKRKAYYATARAGVVIPMGGRITVEDGVEEKGLYPSEVLEETWNEYCQNLVHFGTDYMLLLPEGYVTFENRFKYTYHYYLRDHLGNNRVVVKQDGETIKQINHYYPFGGSFGEETVISNQPYKFGGKELDKMHGLDWHDFGARYQRNDVPSWIGVDPLCEKYYSISPYAYCMNNPIKYIDPTGMIIEDPENIYLRHKDIINEQLLVIQSNLESGGITDGMRSALKQLEKSYKQVLKEYSALEQSEQVYKIFSADVIGGETYYDKGAVMIGIGDTSLGVVGHELKHAYQYEKGEISIRLDNSKEGTLYDIGDETAAYNRERLFNYGVLFFTNPKEYKWSDSDTRAFGRTINAYMNLQNGPVNINSKVGKQMRNNTIKAWGQRIYPTDAYKGVEMDFRKGQRKSR